jgi:hypothetical protein
MRFSLSAPGRPKIGRVSGKYSTLETMFPRKPPEEASKTTSCASLLANVLAEGIYRSLAYLSSLRNPARKPIFSHDPDLYVIITHNYFNPNVLLDKKSISSSLHVYRTPDQYEK